MKPVFALALVVALGACAIFDPPIVLTAGQSWCSSEDPATCERLRAIIDELHTPEMDTAIAAAQSGVPRK